MPEDDDTSRGKKEWFDATVAATVTTGTAVVLTAAQADPVVAQIAALIAGRGTDRLVPSVRRRVERFLVGITKPWEQVPDPAEEFWNRIENEVAGQETWFSATSRLRSLLDPVACEALGILVGQYVRDRRMPDALFRDVSGFLCEVTSPELEECRRLLVQVADLDIKTDYVRAEMQPSNRGAGFQLRFYKLAEEFGGRSLTSMLGAHYDSTAETQAVLRLLGNHGLGELGSAADSGLVFLHIARKNAEMLGALLRDGGVRAAREPRHP